MFKFKGITSTSMQVIIEEEEHFIARAPLRYEVTEIEGKDGAVFDELGYSYIERPILVQCLNVNKIDDILAWLTGEGEFEYKNRKTIARFYSTLEPKRQACIRTIDTTFIRNPFWYKVNEEYSTVTNSVTNEGNIASRPIIKLEKGTTPSSEITIGGVRFKYTFDTNDTYVEIDCEEKIATFNELNRDRKLEIGYDFPKLQVGSNTVIVHNGDASIKIKRKDRWL